MSSSRSMTTDQAPSLPSSLEDRRSARSMLADPSLASSSLSSSSFSSIILVENVEVTRDVPADPVSTEPSRLRRWMSLIMTRFNRMIMILMYPLVVVATVTSLLIVTTFCVFPTLICLIFGVCIYYCIMDDPIPLSVLLRFLLSPDPEDMDQAHPYPYAQNRGAIQAKLIIRKVLRIDDVDDNDPNGDDDDGEDWKKENDKPRRHPFPIEFKTKRKCFHFSEPVVYEDKDEKADPSSSPEHGKPTTPDHIPFYYQRGESNVASPAYPMEGGGALATLSTELATPPDDVELGLVTIAIETSGSWDSSTLGSRETPTTEMESPTCRFASRSLPPPLDDGEEWGHGPDGDRDANAAEAYSARGIRSLEFLLKHSSGDDDSVPESNGEGKGGRHGESSRGCRCSLQPQAADSTISEERKTRAEYEAEVSALVGLVSPDEIDQVDEMMEQFRGREAELVSTLQVLQQRMESQPRDDAALALNGGDANINNDDGGTNSAAPEKNTIANELTKAMGMTTTAMEKVEEVMELVEDYFGITESRERGTTCDICLLDYEVGEEVAWSPNPDCVHSFHKECILDWLIRKPSCPCCRHDYLDMKNDDNLPESQRPAPSSSPTTTAA